MPDNLCPASDPDQRLLEAEEAGPAPASIGPVQGSISMEIVTSDPNTGHCSGLQLSPGRGRTAESFHWPRDAESGDRTRGHQLPAPAPAPLPELVSLHQSWSSSSAPSSAATSSYPRPGARDSRIARATLLISILSEPEYLVTNQDKIVQENN